jgi:hypothetical protein
MLLDLGHQQDLALLLFGDLKGVGTGDALALRMDGKGQGERVFRRSMKYTSEDIYDKSIDV